MAGNAAADGPAHPAVHGPLRQSLTP
jgi:hypothetical protein